MAENAIDPSAYVTWFDRKKRRDVGFALIATGDGIYTLGRQMTRAQERKEWRDKISTIQCVIKAHQEADGTLACALRNIGRNPTLVRIP